MHSTELSHIAKEIGPLSVGVGGIYMGKASVIAKAFDDRYTRTGYIAFLSLFCLFFFERKKA